MASPNLTSACDYPRILVTGIPIGTTKVAVKTLFGQCIVGSDRVLDVELLSVDSKIAAAIITFSGSEGLSEMMEQTFSIGSSELKVRQLYTEKTEITLKDLDSELTSQVPSLAKRWKLKCQEGDSGFTVSGYCDLVKQFKDELENFAKSLIPSADVSTPDPANAYVPGPANSSAVEDISYSSLPSSQPKPDLGPPASAVDPFAYISTEGFKTRTQTGLSCDALILLDTLPEKEIPGVYYDISSGTVLIMARTEQELENLTSRFQDAYQGITAPKKIKTTSIQPSHEISDSQTRSIIDKFKSKYSQCAFRYFEGAVRIVSTSSRQFDHVVKLFKEELKSHKGASPSSRASTRETIVLPHGRTLTLKKADIVEERVEVIVNAANSSLSHSGGVAKAIDEASLGAVQRNSTALVQRNGEVRVGDVAVTHAGGNLQCTYVFHAVGPTKSDHNRDHCRQLLVKVTISMLQQAETYAIQSIAIPAISSGIFGVSKQLVAESVISAILGYKFKSSLPTLSDIRIVIIDDPTYQCFAQHFRLRKTKQLPHTVSPVPAGSPSSLPSPQGPPPQGPPPTTAQPGAEGLSPTTVARKPTAPESKSAGTGEHSNTSSPPGLLRQHSYPGNNPTSAGGNRGGSLPPEHASENNVPLPPSDDENTGGGDDGIEGAGAKKQPSSEEHTPVASSTVSSTTASPPTNDTVSHSTMAGYTSTVTTTSTDVSAATGGQGSSMDINDPLGAGNTTNHSMPAHVSTTYPATSNTAYSHGNTPRTGAATYQYGHKERGKGQSGKRGHNSKAESTAEDKACPICLGELKNPVATKCGHIFCRACIQECSKHSPYCPTCRKALRKVEGNQPTGGTINRTLLSLTLPGYPGCGTIQIDYYIPSGIQSQGHPNPGARYTGTSRTAYLPNNQEGKEVLKLLKKAFDARLIFTVGTSHTSGQSNVVVWNDIHHKTCTHGGPYGYPDPGYLRRVKEDLAAKGIFPDESRV